MRPIVVTAGPYVAASASNIRTASSIAGAGAVTLNGSLVSGGVATLDAQRRVLFTSSGNDSGITFTISGTNASGDLISETLTGGNAAAVYTILDYKTVTAVTASGASAGTVSIGTNGVAGSSWVRLDEYALPNLSIQAVVSGTINYTIQQTYDDPNSATNPVLPSAVNWVQLVAAASASAVSNVAYQPVFVRVLVNSNTNPGALTATFLQTGVVPQ
jgi:hypothetical protein